MNQLESLAVAVAKPLGPVLLGATRVVFLAMTPL